MPKGFFTQTFCLLTNGRASIADIRNAVVRSGFSVAKNVPAAESTHFGGPSIVVPFRPEVNGAVAIDVVNERWPDSMGDPKSDPLLFGAWSTAQYGPFTFPLGLERATQNAWDAPQCKSVGAQHGGYVRLRMSYGFGAREEDRVFPPDYDAMPELAFLNRLTDATLAVPNVLCYFNPNGEVLRDDRSFSATLRGCEEQKKLPLLLWANVRMYRLNESLLFMDTVGNQQFDRPDVEAIFPASDYEPNEVAYYLRNVTHYLLETKREIKSGESFDGPGESNLSWVVEASEKSVVTPPRRVLRLCPQAVVNVVQSALPAT